MKAKMSFSKVKLLTPLGLKSHQTGPAPVQETPTGPDLRCVEQH